MAYLHHVLTHFPVALGVVAALFVLLSWFRPTGPWAATARVLAYLAALGGIVAAATGLLAAAHVAELGGDADAVRHHRNFALPAATALVVTALVMWGAVRAQCQRAAQAGGALSIVAAVAVGYGAHLGGDMLHPGLAPWTDTPHHHGAGAPAASGELWQDHEAIGGTDRDTPGGSPEPMTGHDMAAASPAADAGAADAGTAPASRTRAPSTWTRSPAPSPASGTPPSQPATPGQTNPAPPQTPSPPASPPTSALHGETPHAH